MKILGIETTGSHMGACLWDDFRVRADKSFIDKAPRSPRLMSALDGVFSKASFGPHELDALAVDIGPGRFTGIRLGVSAARTLAQTLQKPLVEMTSLEVLAAEGSGWQTGKSFVWNFSEDMVCVLMDALRGDVYMAVWRFHKLTEKSRRGVPSGRSYHTFSHHFKLVHAPTLFGFDRFLHFFQSCFQAQSLLFVGSAAARYKKELSKAFGSRARFRPDVLDPKPHWVAALGSEKFFRREIKSFTQVRPLYLRPSYAEENAAKLPIYPNPVLTRA
ncbi:MAG: tRNA (adenosine(37)-N6)-threonylcarbamoyltransferase complex dimerization subunit type 1 TsaB [Elusimicrobia bacterium]|nr:tRNA (adenosine(37)-N6)-threonylcarbamoyltransferase complex dimerization subunit type 1 TsaB [Elusimicrobiota bacterium]MBP9127452.1 tRNA (adenosine(37)-N6)-threonylcarbamoyltransferase complex dimerization subunit type 1 TsaB [Elusimicrobiota bacterium]